MRRPIVKWLTPTDIAILELLGDTGLTLSPRILAYEIGRDNVYVQKRLQILMQGALVSKEGRGLYKLTALGYRYLDGEATAEEIPNPDD